jgi:polysaccharide biosynthesis transport protein
MDGESLTPRDFLGIIRRRKWYFVLPAAMIFCLALTAALVWPPTYRSDATVLVEQSEIPEDLVSTLITDYLERRLEAITRRVMVTDNLLRIIERYNLYPEERAQSPISEVVDEMREDISREIISTEVSDPTTGRASSSTVAFIISFDHRDPETAQRITNELVSLYLNENLRQRRARATETTQFLRDERERVEQRISEIERQISAFKGLHAGSLPEQLPYNQQMIARAEQELRDLDRQMQVLREREAYFQAQLALTEPYMLYAAAGRGIPTPSAQLESLRMQLASARGRYGAEHPDVGRLTREVRVLEETLGVSASRVSLERERDTARAELDSLLQRYTPDHPDVQRAQRQLEGLDASVRSASVSGGLTPARPDNPAFIQLQSQVESIRAELPAVIEQRRRIAEQYEAFQAAILKTPLVEGEYQALLRAFEEATRIRDDLALRENTAQLGQTIEVELKGERFILIEPPTLPIDPIRPNKILILALGLVLATCSGFGLVTVAHVLDDAIYSVKDITAILGEAPLSVVPRVVTPGEQARLWTARLTVVAVGLGLVGILLWYVHSSYVPLDVMAYDLQRRFSALVEGIIPVLGGVAVEKVGP